LGRDNVSMVMWLLRFCRNVCSNSHPRISEPSSNYCLVCIHRVWHDNGFFCETVDKEYMRLQTNTTLLYEI